MKRITVPEIAERFGVHVQTAYRWTRLEEFPSSERVAGATMTFDQEEVDRWARGGTEPSKPGPMPFMSTTAFAFESLYKASMADALDVTKSADHRIRSTVGMIQAVHNQIASLAREQGEQ